MDHSPQSDELIIPLNKKQTTDDIKPVVCLLII